MMSLREAELLLPGHRAPTGHARMSGEWEARLIPGQWGGDAQDLGAGQTQSVRGGVMEIFHQCPSLFNTEAGSQR